ncbi:hypothetical protein ABPG72_009767 [Tetrahymena utriculariae]
MNYMESSYEYTELTNVMNRINEIDKITSDLALEKLNLQKKLEQLKQQIQNIHYQSFQNGRTYFDEYENNQNCFLNNGMDNFCEFSSMISQYPYCTRVQNNIQNNGNANPYYSSDQAMMNDHVDDYFDTEFNQKMYFPKQVSNEKLSSFNNLNQLNLDNPIIENNLQLNKEDLTKTFINNDNQKLDHEVLPSNNNSQILITNSNNHLNGPIQNDNIHLSIYQNNSQITSKIQAQPLETQEQKGVQNNSVLQLKYNNSLQSEMNPSSKQPSTEQFINKDQHESQLSPSYNRLLKKNSKQCDLILQTPQQNSDDKLDYEKQQITKSKGVSGFNKIIKQKNKHFKKNSASETIKLCKYNHAQNKKTKCFTKEQSITNQDCLSQFENSFLQSIQNLNHDELIPNNKNNLNQNTQTNLIHFDEGNNGNSQTLTKLKEENFEKQRQQYLSQKKQFLESLPEDTLKFQFSKQLQYLQGINLCRSTSDENIETINTEEPFENSSKKSQKSRSDQKQNNSQKQSILEIGENGMNEETDTSEVIQRMYQNFLINFNNNKGKYTKREKGYYRYPSTLKMKVVEFSRYIKLIQIQKDTQISQETIRKWQKRYTEIPDQMVEYNFLE